MPLSRRSFLNALNAMPEEASPSNPLAGREREKEQAASAPPPKDSGPLQLDKNENPYGPGPHAMEAMAKGYDFAGRYPTNARPNTADLRDTIARKLGVRPENVLVANGSGELLRIATRVYTSPSRHLVAASPTFGAPEEMARQIGSPVRSVAVDQEGRIDLDKMAVAARWGGLVFFCNPNNPTATVHGFKSVADFVGRVRSESPQTAILIDEAYHDYVEDPGYGTALALALEHPDVLVTRTLSKAYGMAGMRVGYAVAQARTIDTLRRWVMTFTTNSVAQSAAVASLKDQGYIDRERARNTEVRKYVTRFFNDLGFKTTDSQGNFVFVDIKRPAKDFKEACAKQAVIVGRDFPPLEKSWARISLGTMDQMKRATAVFASVLKPAPKGGAQEPDGTAATQVSK